MPVTVVTDTTHYLPPETVAELGVREVSLYVRDDEGQRREADIDVAAFYAQLRTAVSMPTTSQPSIGDFLAVYEPLAEAGHDVVSIHLAGALSGTLESARQAAADMAKRTSQRRIECVDSRTGAAGLGMVVLAAAAVARAGGDVDAVAERARRASEDQKIWFAVETLEYLRRGGRIGAAQAWVGGALKIKPILTFDGEVTPIERVRTTSRARDRLLDYLQARKDDGATAWCVQHIDAFEEAEALAERGRDVMGHDPLFVTQVGPVVGAHIGPGMVGLGGVRPELLR
jgi:DegV family protein with EDD domain